MNITITNSTTVEKLSKNIFETLGISEPALSQDDMELLKDLEETGQKIREKKELDFEDEIFLDEE